MGCDSCSNNTSGVPNGCKSNGNCGVGGCGKLDVFDWLAGMELPEGRLAFDIVEVRFKNDRKEFFRKNKDQDLFIGDVVTVQMKSGYDVGIVSSTGEIVRMLMKNKNVKDNHEIFKIRNKSTQEEIEKWQAARAQEWDVMIKARTYAIELGLTMKISDVEFQGDNSKATFYYTAEGRVDFRELIKRFAGTFKVRVEMRQIGARQEAGKLGAIGSCGRELCCSTWLTDFRTVSTNAARYQQLSLNPSKLAGQCGKLKCCLNFELDQYLDCIKDFPSTKTKLKTKMGGAVHFKTDVFKKMMYYIYLDHRAIPPVALPLDAVHEIIEMNKNGESPETLNDFTVEEVFEESTEYLNVVGQDSLTRFDKSKKKKRRPNNKRKSGNAGRSNPKSRNNSNKPGNAKKKTPRNPNAKPNAKPNPNAKPKAKRGPSRNSGKPGNNRPNPKAGASKPKPNKSSGDA